MLTRVLDIDGLLALILAFPLFANLFTRHFVLPKIAYRLGAAMGFCGWLVFSASGGTTSYSGGGLLGAIADWYVMVAPFLLPVEAGYLGWLGLGSTSRWLLLELVLAAGFLPILAAVVLHLPTILVAGSARSVAQPSAVR